MATHIQGQSNRNDGAVTTVSVTLSAAPTTGNLVCVGVFNYTTVQTSGLTVVDNNSNSYTVTPHSPSGFTSGVGIAWLAYLLSAPSNASATITANWTGSSGGTIFADEFSGGPFIFDVDVVGDGSIAGTTINTPVITPTNSNELLYSTAYGSTVISAPTPGTTIGIWTGNSSSNGWGFNRPGAEYCLSASGPTAVQYNQSNHVWEAMGMAFSFPQPPVFITFDMTPGTNVTWRT